MKGAYKEAVIEVQDCVNQNKFTSRKDRYQIIELLTGVSKGTIEKILRYDRAVRDVFPEDEVGERLESEWHKTPQIHQFENETTHNMNQLFKPRVITN